MGDRGSLKQMGSRVNVKIFLNFLYPNPKFLFCFLKFCLSSFSK